MSITINGYSQPPILGSSTIAASTGSLGIATPETILVSYTGTGAVTDLEFTDAAVTAQRRFHIIDTGGNASVNNITIKNTANTTQAVITEDYGSITLVSDGTSIYQEQ